MWTVQTNKLLHWSLNKMTLNIFSGLKVLVRDSWSLMRRVDVYRRCLTSEASLNLISYMRMSPLGWCGSGQRRNTQSSWPSQVTGPGMSSAFSGEPQGEQVTTMNTAVWIHNNLVYPAYYLTPSPSILTNYKGFSRNTLNSEILQKQNSTIQIC